MPISEPLPSKLLPGQLIISRDTAACQAIRGIEAVGRWCVSNTDGQYYLTARAHAGYKGSMAVEIEPFYVSLGERIQLFRTRRKLTQGQLGAQLDPATTRASVANIEAGKQRVLAHTLVQIASALQVDIHELIPTSEQRPNKGSSVTLVGELKHKLRISKSAARQLAEQLKASGERKLA